MKMQNNRPSAAAADPGELNSDLAPLMDGDHDGAGGHILATSK